MKFTLTKITIITESLLTDNIVTLLKKHNATGYTLAKVEGEGSKGTRASDWEGQNTKIESLVSPEIADAVLEELDKRYFEDYAVVAWLSEVEVLRGEKFIRK